MAVALILWNADAASSCCGSYGSAAIADAGAGRLSRESRTRYRRDEAADGLASLLELRVARAAQAQAHKLICDEGVTFGEQIEVAGAARGGGTQLRRTAAEPGFAPGRHGQCVGLAQQHAVGLAGEGVFGRH